MFQEAAANHLTWNCVVGGGSSFDKKLYGTGCALDNIHTLTAHHIWSEIANQYDWPYVLRQDGTFKCEIVFESRDHDIMILRSIDRISEKTPNSINVYPTLSGVQLYLGAPVGFIARLRGHKPNREYFSYACFASAIVSIILPSEPKSAAKFALSSTVWQPGFSGSSVFRPDGSIVGVLHGGMTFPNDFQDPSSPISTLPLISPIFPLIEQLKIAILKSGTDPKAPS